MSRDADFVVYRVVPEESTVKIHALSSIHPIDLEAFGIEGRVELALVDGKPDLSRTVVASVGLALADLSSGYLAYDAEMQRRLEVRRYPNVSGDLTGAAPGGSEQSYRVTGNLTFHGATREVDVEMVVSVSSSGLTADWVQEIDLRDFNLRPPRILMLRVAPGVRVEIHIVAEPV